MAKIVQEIVQETSFQRIIDRYGRIVIPKKIREQIPGNRVILVYDKKNEDVHIVPVKSISAWKGRFSGITKEYLKHHGETDNDTYRG